MAWVLRAPVWGFATGGAVYSAPAVVGGLVYVGSEDHNVYCLSATDGHSVWSYKTGDEVESSPAVVNGVAYVARAYKTSVYKSINETL